MDHFKRHVSGTGIFHFRNDFLENTNGFIQYVYCLSNTSYFNKAVISLTHGIEYHFQYDNNKTCIEVKMDVKFTLTNGTEMIKFDGSDFKVKSGDCAFSNESAAMLTLTIGNDNFLHLQFQYDAKNKTTMGAMFSVSPYEYFPGTPTPSKFQVMDYVHATYLWMFKFYLYWCLKQFKHMIYNE